MAKRRKNYHKKPIGSVAVLGYYVVVPFYNKTAHLSNLQELAGRAGDAEDIVLASIKYACAQIQSSFVVGDELFDDGLVEMYPVVSETHVAIYMKLPATLAVHSAISQLRIYSSKFLYRTELKGYKLTYSSLYDSKYLAMCAPNDATGAACVPINAYSGYLKAFFLENNLEGNPQNIHQERKRVFGHNKVFMSDKFSLYT